MSEKVSRNDPCPCGSGKKYKQCCLKKDRAPRKITAKWINAPQQGVSDSEKKMPNLMERTFGDAISKAGDKPPTPEPHE